MIGIGASPLTSNISHLTSALDHFRSRNPIQLFTESGSRQRFVVLSSHAGQFKRDSFARAALSLTSRDLIDHAAQSFTDAGDVALRLRVTVHRHRGIFITQLTRHWI